MTGPKGWLDKFLKSDSQRAERRPVKNFASYRWAGTAVKQDPVRDVSTTGVYILTEERWKLGTLLALTLQREGPLEVNPDRRITTHALVVRSGEDGVGLSFLMPKDPISVAWEGLLEGIVEQTKMKDMTSMVRMATALAFLKRLCPDGVDQISHLLRGRLSNHKVAHAAGIALKAESLLATRPAVENLRAAPQLLVRVLEDGTATDEDWLRQFWAGLLVSSCTSEGQSQLDTKYIELFSKLTTFPVRILTVVCTRATKYVTESGAIAARPLACKMDEIMTTTGSRGTQMQRDIDCLSELGLIEKREDSSLSRMSGDETLITPTSLGLDLLARCNGHQRSFPDFYAVESSSPAKASASAG